MIELYEIVFSMYYYCSVLMIFHFLPVDSIGWIRDDSIVIGCVRLNEDDNEEGYLVQVIGVKKTHFVRLIGPLDAFFSIIGFISHVMFFLSKSFICKF